MTASYDWGDAASELGLLELRERLDAVEEIDPAHIARPRVPAIYLLNKPWHFLEARASLQEPSVELALLEVGLDAYVKEAATLDHLREQ